MRENESRSSLRGFLKNLSERLDGLAENEVGQRMPRPVRRAVFGEPDETSQKVLSNSTPEVGSREYYAQQVGRISTEEQPRNKVAALVFGRKVHISMIVEDPISPLGVSEAYIATVRARRETRLNEAIEDAIVDFEIKTFKEHEEV